MSAALGGALLREGLALIGTVGAPLLLGLLAVGLVVGVLQAATQVNEASIGFLAKLIVMGMMLALLGSWSMQNLVEYTRRTIGSIADVVR